MQTLTLSALRQDAKSILLKNCSKPAAILEDFLLHGKKFCNFPRLPAMQMYLRSSPLFQTKDELA
jgi:hypothetical protein